MARFFDEIVEIIDENPEISPFLDLIPLNSGRQPTNNG